MLTSQKILPRLDDGWKTKTEEVLPLRSFRRCLIKSDSPLWRREARHWRQHTQRKDGDGPKHKDKTPSSPLRSPHALPFPRYSHRPCTQRARLVRLPEAVSAASGGRLRQRRKDGVCRQEKVREQDKSAEAIEHDSHRRELRHRDSRSNR